MCIRDRVNKCVRHDTKEYAKKLQEENSDLGDPRTLGRVQIPPYRVNTNATSNNVTISVATHEEKEEAANLFRQIKSGNVRIEVKPDGRRVTIESFENLNKNLTEKSKEKDTTVQSTTS